MDKSNRLILVLALTILVIIVGFRTAQVQANQAGTTNSVEQEEIKNVINTYFEMRYRSHVTMQLEDFEHLVIDSPRGNIFLRSENDKLEIELHHAKLNGLGYVKYDYYLDFIEINLDSTYQSAFVSVVEGHDIEFDVSTKISKEEPIVSSMRNLQHAIELQKVDDVWKIISDDYNDYLWRLLKVTGLSKEEYLAYSEEFQTITGGEGYLSPTFVCDLQEDESTYDYNRAGAVDYAHDWALGRNPDYYDFTQSGGDCQNFVSQAIFEGGGAIMAFSDTSGYGEPGWYYRSASDYAAAWTGVDSFRDFVVPGGYLEWDTGPEGCLLDQGLYQANEGDVIQYDWENNGSWDHSVIIVQSFHNPPDWNHLVASHSPDHDNYPYTYFIYENPSMVTRFIRIERLDGNLAYLALILNSSISAQMQNPLMDPYPAPLGPDGPETPSPYPPPSVTINHYAVPYPAP